MLKEREKKTIVALRDRPVFDAQELLEARLTAGLSRAEFSGALGVSRSAYHAWETGVKQPSRRQVDRLLAAIALLKGGDGAAPP
jgi:repressor LexA